MRYSAFVSICVAFILIFSFSASAAGDSSASLSVTETYDSLEVGSKITVKAELCDINSDAGIACIEYNILFDNNVFKLDSYNVNFPTLWRDDIETEMAESLSVAGDGVFKWAIVNAEIGKGVKEDGELFVELVFEILDTSSAETDIYFNCVAVTDDMLDSVDCDSYVMNLSLEGGSVDVEASDENYSTDYSIPSASTPESQVSDVVSDANISQNSDAASENTQTVSDSENNNSILGMSVGLFAVIASAVLVAAIAAVVLIVKKRRG